MIASQVLDVYGTEGAARRALKRALIAERRFGGLSVEKRDDFIAWAFERADHYHDDDKIDWIGALYDWIEK